MCGIYVRVSEASAPKSTLVDISHRGPDAFSQKEFTVSDWRVILAHWRLSIIDPNPVSDQPFCRSPGGAWIVFNGEIYNYRELRAGIGGNFNTASDTEVLLAAYGKWGFSCLDKLRGMFAFVIFDPRKNCLFAARDRFGIKPLYYRKSANFVEFGSEIKQLLPPQPQGNLQRIKDFLFYGAQDHTEETLFDGIFQLQGGESVVLDLAENLDLKKSAWYSLDTIRPFEGDSESAVKAYKAKFFETVDLHLRSDVPLGFCLSGGMDSSAILATAANLLRNSDESLAAIHCQFSGKRFDESRYADLAADSAGARLVQISPEPSNLLADLAKVTYYQDEPVQNASIISSYHVFRAGHEAGLKVMLDGQGGDEQLASYPQFFPPYLLGLALRGRFGEVFSEARHFATDHQWTWLDTIRSALLWYSPGLFAKAKKWFEAAYSPPQWVNPDFFRFNGTPMPPWKMTEDETPTTRAMSVLMLRKLSLPMLLHWEDRNSMASSLESRVPFMDHELVELALSFPDQVKIYQGVTKRVLKAAMSDLVPPEIIQRRDKMGFTTPEEAWLRSEATTKIKDLIHSLPVDLKAVVNERGFRSEWGSFLNGDQYKPIYWRLLALQVWQRVFHVQF